MFLAQLLLDAAPDTGKVLTLTVRYYINDAGGKFCAAQQRLEAGAHTLALFTRLRRWRPGRSRGCRCGWSARVAR